MQDRNPKGKIDPAYPLLFSISTYTLSEAHPPVTQTFYCTQGYSQGNKLHNVQHPQAQPTIIFYFFYKGHFGKKIQKYNLPTFYPADTFALASPGHMAPFHLYLFRAASAARIHLRSPLKSDSNITTSKYCSTEAGKPSPLLKTHLLSMALPEATALVPTGPGIHLSHAHHQRCDFFSQLCTDQQKLVSVC